MYALTSTGTTVKSFQNEAKSVRSGRSLGIIKPSLNNFMMTIPAVMTRKTTARPTDMADVNLKESVMKHKPLDYIVMKQKPCTRNLKTHILHCILNVSIRSYVII